MSHPMCGHGELAVRRQVRKEGPNKDRHFWSCPRWAEGGGCGFFAWDHPGLVAVASPSSSPRQADRVKLELVSLTTLLVSPALPGTHLAGGVRQALAPHGRPGDAGGVLLPLEQLEAAAKKLGDMGVSLPPIPPNLLTGVAQLKWSDVSLEDVAARVPFFDKLYPYQQEGVRFCSSRKRCILGDEMGLGKTVQAIGAVSFFEALPLVIVCPKSLCANWKNEITTWKLASEDEICTVKTGKSPIDKGSRVVIVSYDLAGKVAGQILKLAPKSYILDEAHFLKNPKASRTQAVEELVKAAADPVVLVLTGTPALNRPAELFPLLRLAGCNVYKSFKPFGDRYCAPTMNRFSGGLDYKGADHLNELRMLLGQFMIRRLKKDVLRDLPAKLRTVVHLDSRAKKAPKLNRGVLSAVKINQEVKNAFADSAEGKLSAVSEYLADFLDDESAPPCLVFAHHHVMLDGIEALLHKKKLGFIRIDGATPASVRGELVEKFENDQSVRVALLSITAAGVGLTLTRAKCVLFTEIYWNHGTIAQCEDRAHRIGQNEAVLIKYLILPDTIDEVIFRIVRAKLDVIQKALGDESDSMQIPASSVEAHASSSSAAQLAAEPEKLYQFRVRSNALPSGESPMSCRVGSSFRDVASLVVAKYGLSSSLTLSKAVLGGFQVSNLDAAIPDTASGKILYLHLVADALEEPTDEASDSSNDNDVIAPSPGKVAISPPPAPSPRPLKRQRPKPPCKYGSLCYRKNPDHIQQFYHPQHDGNIL